MPSIALSGEENKLGLVNFQFWSSLENIVAMTSPSKLPGRATRAFDVLLRDTMDYESMWAGAISTACTLVSARKWEVDGDVIGLGVKPSEKKLNDNSLKTSHDMLHDSEGGGGWVPFISKITQDYSLCNNGAIIEIERVVDKPNAKITRLWALDSLSCYRTGRRDIPLIYTDIWGKLHYLKPHNFLSIVDMPSPNQWHRGTGRCAADRAYRAIYRMVALDTFITLKLTGESPLDLHFLQGISDKQLGESIDSAKTETHYRGIEQHMGAIITAVLGDMDLKVTTIPLATLPNGVSREFETQLAIQAYANALGYDKQQLFPTSGQAIGVGAQSQVQDDQAQNKGLQSLLQQLTHLFNSYIMPKKVTFGFLDRNIQDEQAHAAISQTRFATMGSGIQTGVILPVEARQMLVDWKEIPPELLLTDITAAQSITDTENAAAELDPNRATPQQMVALQQSMPSAAPPAPVDPNAPAAALPPGQNPPPASNQVSARAARLLKLAKFAGGGADETTTIKERVMLDVLEENAARLLYKKLTRLPVQPLELSNEEQNIGE